MGFPFNLISCDQLEGESRETYDNLKTDICDIVHVKYVLTCLCIAVLSIGCIYVWKRYDRCHKTLLAFHNLRAAVSLLLLAVNSVELARSLLPQRRMEQLYQLFDSTPKELNVLIIIGSDAVWNALAAILLTIMLMCYHRVLERKKMTAFLFASIVIELLIFLLRIDELAEVAYYEDILELETCLLSVTVLCLLSLAAIDAYTIYKERYRDDYLEDYDRIGYKHSLATFYSKSCFWWLTSLLWLGYKEPLELRDLGQMRLEDSARAHYDRFLYIYTEKVKKSNAPPSLWLCYMKNSWRMFALGGFLKLAGDLFALIGPLAIQQIVQYIEGLYAAAEEQAAHTAAAANRSILLGVGAGSSQMFGPNADTNGDDVVYYDDYYGDVRIYYARWSDLLTNGWSIAWLVLLAALAQAALSQASTHVLNMTGIRIKTSLQGLIYRKTLLLNASSGCANNAADDSGGSADSQDPAASPAPPTPADVQQNGKNIRFTPNQEPAERASAQQTERSGDPGDVGDVGAITNHMTEDTLNIMQFFWIAHYAWAIPFKIALVIYLLYLKLGVSAVIGAIVCIVIMTPLQFLIGRAMSRNEAKIAKFTDERLKKIHDTLIGIKIIKLNAWDDVFLRTIQTARKKELKYLRKDAMYWTLMTILTHICSVLITFVTLAVYVYLPQESQRNFDASHLFAALALFQQLTVPLLIFPITVPIIIAARVSTRRLERFLHAPEIQKQFEGIRNMARILSKSDASLDMYETQEKSNMALRTAQVENRLNEHRQALRIRMPEEPPSPAPLAQSEPITPLLQANGEPGEDKTPPLFNQELGHQKIVQHRKELLRNTPYVAIRPPKLFAGTPDKPLEFSVLRARNTDSWRRDSLLLKMPDDIAVSINDGCFTWHPQFRSLPKLHIQEMAIPKGKLTIIVGKTGSGKTSLLSALLMEMPLVEGNMFWHKNCTISYVPQSPWLLNDTIMQNILFGESFRPKRYDFVLDACALKPDIALMPSGDFTIIGERGINLSGGQKQRIAIARAIYSSANVVIMDDPLSSLDNEVGSHVFEQCVRQMLLKSSRTIILVTQQLQLIREADYLIVMKDGRLQACGSYKDIELKQPQIIAKWNSIIAKANENANDQQQNSTERTARERWKLFKNVSKLGLQRSISINSETGGGGNYSELDAVCSDGSASMSFNNMLTNPVEEDEEDDDLPASLSLASGISCGLQSSGSFHMQRKRGSVYGSRHLIYDVPLPIDECQADDVIMRPRRRGTLHRRGSSTRSRNSWHRLSGLSSATITSTSSTNSADLLRRSLMTASCSSYAESSADGGDSIADGVTAAPSAAVTELHPRALSWQPQQQAHHAPVSRNASSPPAMEAAQSLPTEPQSRGSFQQFLRRMSMRRSNKPKHHHRPLSAANSIRSISEESSAAALLPTVELSSVPAPPAADSSNPQSTTTATSTSSLTTAGAPEMRPASSGPAAAAAAAAPPATAEAPVKHVKIDFNALPTNANANTNNNNNINNNNNNKSGSNNNNNNNNDANEAQNDNDGDDVDVSDVTSRPTQEKGKREKLREIAGERRERCPGAVSTMATASDAERKYGQISNHIYLLYMRASGLPVIVVFFITALIWQCLRVYTDVWLQHWSDHVHEHQPKDSMSTSGGGSGGGSWNAGPDAGSSHEVTYYFRMYATISCVCIIMAMISTPAGQWAGCNASRNLHDKLLQTILHKTLHFFQVTPLGRILNRFSSDMAIIDKKIAATSQRLLQFSLLCLCAVLINVSITPWFLVLTLPICGAYYAIQKFYRCSARELQRIENSTSSPVISHLAETIQGVTTIRAYNQQARFTEILFNRLEANTIAFTILNTSNRWLGISLDYLGGCIVFVAIVTALAAASVSCSSYAKAAAAAAAAGAGAVAVAASDRTTEMAGTYAINKGASSKELTLTLTPTPSLVGLAINYTLLVPIYLNWVVKLLADMEMYAGSVERIAHYAQQPEQLEQEWEQLSERQREQRSPEITNEVDRSSCTRSVDKVYPGATSAGVDVAGASAADKLNAGRAAAAAAAAAAAEGSAAGSGNHLNLHTAPVVDKRQLATTATRTSMIKDKGMTASGDKVAKSNEPARRIRTYRSVPISWPQRGDISFEDVSLRYEGQRQNVISHLSLKIPAGQRIGVCGRTGSGKSSLALSLFGVLETTGGHIRIDDVDIEQIRAVELRTRLSIIPQDVHLFNATIRENLDPHGYYSDLQLWNCLELAQLKEFVNVQLPQGLDTEISDGGISFSAGHRQLLCLARAILRGSACLVLDEATSMLDSSTERALLKAADKAFQGRTIITIAHRLSTILDYERIIVLEQGQIVEDGNPRQLQQQPSSIFHGLLHKGELLAST